MFKLSSKVRPLFAFTALFFLLSSSGFAGEVTRDDTKGQDSDESKGQAGKEDKPVALVNGVPIQASLFHQKMKTALLNLGHGELPAQRMAEIRKETLEGLINGELVSQKARETRQSPNDLMIQEVYNKVTVGDDEMKSYFQGHRDEFMKPEGIRLRHLLFPVDPSASTLEWKTAYDRALEVSNRAGKGEAFEALIREAAGPDAEGLQKDLKIEYQGQMSFPEFDPAAFQLKTGEVSRPIQTLYGFYLIQAVEKVPPAPYAWEEINKIRLRNRLVGEKTGQRIREWIEELRNRAEIKVYQPE